MKMPLFRKHVGPENFKVVARNYKNTQPQNENHAYRLNRPVGLPANARSQSIAKARRLGLVLHARSWNLPTSSAIAERQDNDSRRIQVARWRSRKRHRSTRSV